MPKSASADNLREANGDTTLNTRRYNVQQCYWEDRLVAWRSW